MRHHDILKGIEKQIAEHKTYDGKKRSELKDSDFLFPETRSFPIVSPEDVKNAISNFGRMKGNMSYEAFLRKLYDFAKRKGPSFVAALPKESKEKLGLKAAEYDGYYDDPAYDNYLYPYDREIMYYPQPIAEDDEDEEELFDVVVESPMTDDEEDSSDDEMSDPYYNMNVACLRSIITNAQSILSNLENPQVQENLTEPWLHGKIVVTEDYLRTIHDFLMFTSEATDKISSAEKQGLWENIRKKKEREGKDYKPAKPGDPDRPSPDAYKEAQK